jgi:hypothetical protein
MAGHHGKVFEFLVGERRQVEPGVRQVDALVGGQMLARRERWPMLRGTAAWPTPLASRSGNWPRCSWIRPGGTGKSDSSVLRTSWPLRCRRKAVWPVR